MKINFIQKIIDKIRNKPHSYISLLGTKVLSFEKIKDKIDTLILGSSHAQFGYRAKANEFNLGLSYQDLYHSYNLCKKSFKHPHKIKTIVLFYSVFSPGHQQIRTRDFDICSIYKAVCQIDYQDENIAKEKQLEKLTSKFNKQYKHFKKKFKLNIQYRGNETSFKTATKTKEASERALPHFKNNQRNNNQTQYVEKIYNIAKENNAKLLIVIPPATKSYKDCLPSSDVLFKELYELQKKLNFNIINVYDNTSFNDNDFKDWDHLNLTGAEKLTKIISSNR